MKRPTNRRAVLMAAGAAAVVAATARAAAQSTHIRGTVAFKGNEAIPEGQLDIYLEDPAIKEKTQRRGAETRIKSSGGSKKLEFSLPLTASPAAASPTLRIVARLERADGWLVARGSAKVEVGSPVHVTLKTVMY